MIETTIPEISVSELMNRVRARVDEMRRNRARPKFPPLYAVERIPSAIPPKAVSPKTEQIAGAIHFAREATTVTRWIPKPLRGFFRRQGKVNHQVLRALESLGAANAQMADRLRHLIACVEVQDHGIQHLADLRRADTDWMNAAAQILVMFSDKFLESRTELDKLHSELTLPTQDALAQLADRLSSVERAGAPAAKRLAEFETTSAALSQQISTIAAESASLRDHLAALEQKLHATDDQLVAVMRQGEQLAIETDSVGDHVRALQTASDHLNTLTANVQRELAMRDEHDRHFIDQLQGETAQRAAVGQDVASLEQRYTTDGVFIKAELSRHSAVFQKLFERILPGKNGKLKIDADNELAKAAGHQLDAFYFSFENRFRGPREEIKRRLKFYMPLLKKTGNAIRKHSIIDLGCGRGEWLELLREEKLNATGIDLNQAMLDQCRERGLEVVESDVLEFLRGLPDNSRSAVTGFHIIEHLPLEILVNLISETFRVLRPGGIAIFESPNCKNLSVGACFFYMDPTHRNPVFPETAQFMLESCGFERVTLEYLSPVDTNDLGVVAQEPAYLRELLYGPRDFGVIGYKSKPRSRSA